MDFLTFFVSGLSLGSEYAIITLGYSMVYGIAKILNFAHGDVIMIGGYVSFVTMTSFGINPIFNVFAAAVACMVLGIVIERVACGAVGGANSLSVLITTFGVSYLLQNLALLIYAATSTCSISQSDIIFPFPSSLPNAIFSILLSVSNLLLTCIKIASVLYEYIPYKLLLISSLLPVILLSDIVIKLSLVFIFFPFDNVKTDIMFVFASVFPPTIISLLLLFYFFLLIYNFTLMKLLFVLMSLT